MNTLIRTKLHSALYCALGTVVLGAMGAMVQAAAEELASKTVRFNDLNVATTAGANVLYGRIRAAARDVCAQSIGSDPIERAAMYACIAKAIDAAVKKVDAPALTALRFGGNADVRLASK